MHYGEHATDFLSFLLVIFHVTTFVACVVMVVGVPLVLTGKMLLKKFKRRGKVKVKYLKVHRR